MVIKYLQSEILLELVLRVGNETDETVILNKCIPFYMRKLSCILAGVLKQEGENLKEKMLVPVAAGKSKDWEHVKDQFLQIKNSNKCSVKHINDNGINYYAFCMGGYGILILGRKKIFEETFLHELEPVIHHLGKALILADEIRQRKNAELALLENQKLFSLFIKHSPIYAFIKEVTGSEHRILYASENFKDVIGVSGEEMVGKNMLELFPPDDAKNFIADDQAIIENGKIHYLDETFKGRSFKTFKFPIFTEKRMMVGGYTLDVTEQLQAENALRESEALLRKSQHVGQIGSYELDIKTGVWKSSSTMNELFGIDEDYICDLQGWLAIAHPDERESLVEYFSLNVLQKRENFNKEYRIVRPDDNKIRWVHGIGELEFNDAGEPVRMIGTIQDVTERKLIEKALLEAKEKAEESDRLKSAFLANMSHEIRTPMNGILGFAELLKEAQLSGEEQQQYINIIEESGTRMLSIINDIISISKVESGQMDVILSATNINEQIDYIHTFFKPEVRKKGLRIKCLKSLPDEVSIIETDREKVYAILTNLMKNAIKFTDSGSIEFGYIVKGDKLEYFVKDTGHGVHQDQHDLIFERFRQGSDSLTRNYEGAGLGLSITKAYVKMLGGDIWIESNNTKGGTGSVFYFTLPYKRIKQEHFMEAPEQEIDDPSEKKLKLLIVEDDVESEMFIEIVLKKYFKERIKVNDGAKAIEICKANPDIDLVLMDIKMPEMDGYEATEKIRKFNKDIVIIAQTAFGLVGDREKAINAGCTDYISKPIQKEKLIAMIRKYFDI